MDSSPPAEAKSGLTIQNKYTFWYMRRSRGGGVVESYEDSIKPLGTFQTVEGFWSIYNHIVRPNDMTQPTELHLFKHGIKPMWEDENNARGGKAMIRLKKGLASHFWEELLLSIIGEQFDVGNEICGAVVSLRQSEDILSVWNRNADNLDAVNKIRDHMRRLFSLPGFITVDYKRHDNTGHSTIHRPRRNSSVGSDGDGAAGGTSVGSGGSSAPGMKWRSRRMMQQKAAAGTESVDEPPASTWGTGAAAPRERGGRPGSRATPEFDSGSGGRAPRAASESRDVGSGWGTRGAGFDRSRREPSWGSTSRGPPTGSAAPAPRSEGGGSTFWRTADPDGTRGSAPGFSGDSRRSGGFGASGSAAWRSGGEGSGGRWGRDAEGTSADA